MVTTINKKVGVEVGEAVDQDYPLIEVETEKASVEIPSPVSGTIVALHAGAGEMVAVGAPLITFETADQGGIVGTVPAERQPSRRVRLRPPSAS